MIRCRSPFSPSRLSSIISYSSSTTYSAVLSSSRVIRFSRLSLLSYVSFLSIMVLCGAKSFSISLSSPSSTPDVVLVWGRSITTCTSKNYSSNLAISETTSTTPRSFSKDGIGLQTRLYPGSSITSTTSVEVESIGG